MFPLIYIAHIKEGLTKIEGVLGVHDVHVWSLEGETDIFTGHIVVRPQLLQKSDDTRKAVKDELAKHHIEHSTIELETEQFCSGVECNNGYST